MKPLILATAAFGALVSGDTLAAEQRVSCPLRLEPEAIQSNKPPPGWELHMLRPASLTEGGMLHGPPSESAFLVPDGTNTHKVGKQTMETQRWTFALPHPYQTWLYCGYGGGGATLKIFKKVLDSVTECTLSSQSADGRTKESMEFSCK